MHTGRNNRNSRIQAGMKGIQADRQELKAFKEIGRNY